MIDTPLLLPLRESSPRRRGLTMMIDTGLPTGWFEDVIDSTGEYVDLVKFGWCTALVTRDLKRKIDILQRSGIGFYFGGTLFERFAVDDMVDDWRRLCRGLGVTYVEVSNGTIAMSNAEKARWVAALRDDFTVISEVGHKDGERAAAMASDEWVESIHADLDAGAHLVTTEARASGKSGICTADGVPRDELVEAILDSGVDVDRLLFEAPTTELQTYFVRRLGPSVNLGNIASDDVIALETLRLGLRSDTMATEAVAAVVAG